MGLVEGNRPDHAVGVAFHALGVTTGQIAEVRFAMGDAQVKLLGLRLALKTQQAVHNTIEPSLFGEKARFGFGAELLFCQTC